MLHMDGTRQGVSVSRVFALYGRNAKYTEVSRTVAKQSIAQHTLVKFVNV